MNYTTNYNLKKPTDSDMYDVADFSGNMDLIDEQLKTNADDITDVEKPTFEDYTNPETEVPDADTAMAAIKSKTSIGVLFQNIKAFFKGAITIGKLVDNCTSTSTDLGLTANQGKVLMDRILGVEEDVSELNAEIQCGMRNGLKNGDTVKISQPVQTNSIVFVMPRYNTGTTMACSFSQVELFPGQDNFALQGYDISTGQAPVSTNLSIAYFVLPV